MRITEEQFTQYINALRLLRHHETALQDHGIDLMAFMEWVCELEAPLLEAIFNKAQRETIDWWLYDAPKGIEGDPTTDAVQMWDENGVPIYTRNAKELYAYLLTEDNQ